MREAQAAKSLKGVLEIRPFGDTGCNGLATPEKTTKAGKRIQPVVSFWPKAYAKGGACSKYLEDQKDETGGVLPDEALFHELVHVFRMASGESESQPLTQGGRMNYDSVEEFIAVLVTNIYITDPSNKSHSKVAVRRDNLGPDTWELSKRSENTVLRLIPRQAKNFLIGCRTAGRSDFRFNAIGEPHN